MNADPARPSGIWSPVLTPFDAMGAPCAARLLAHGRWLLSQDVGLALFGTNSEANSMSVREKTQLLEHLLAHGVPAHRLLPGTGACALEDTVSLTRVAVRAGCAGVLVLPPFFYKDVSDEGLFRGYARLIEAVGDDRLRLYLYNIPPVTGIRFSLPLIDRLLRAFPGIVAGIKDSSGDWAYTQRLLEEMQPRGLDVFTGNETALLPTLRAGGAGCITATANVNAGAIAELHRRWRSDEADALQARLNEVRAVFQRHPMIAAMKSALAWKSGDEGWTHLRPPLVELDGDARAALHEGLDRIGFQMPALPAR